MSWICPHCGTTATLQAPDIAQGEAFAIPATAKDEEAICIRWNAIKCPSSACGKFVFDVAAIFGTAQYYMVAGRKSRSGKAEPDRKRPVGIGKVRFEPRVGQPLSNHVPQAVIADYEEACLIKDLSPKAAATLCRRALQGMVRHRWSVSKNRLAEELKAIKDQCDPDLYNAMMSLKAVGNIGAHPERDVDVIVEVEEGEVDSLLELLSILDKEWFVARAARNASLASVVALGVSKELAQRTGVINSTPK